MKQENTTSTPLWRVLNERRTQSEWITVQHLSKAWGLHEKAEEGEPDGSGSILGTIGHAGPSWNTNQSKANAQYTALAVNNLASLAEEMQGFIDNVIENPKLYLNQISYYKGRFKKALQAIS